MKELEYRFSDNLRQSIKCQGKITNLSRGINVELDERSQITDEEFVVNFLNQFRSNYGIVANEYNQKEYKKFLAQKIKEMEDDLKKLKFAHKICGRKIV